MALPAAQMLLFALGQRILFHHALRGGWVFIVAAILALILVRYWPAIIAWAEQRRRRRR